MRFFRSLGVWVLVLFGFATVSIFGSGAPSIYALLSGVRSDVLIHAQIIEIRGPVPEGISEGDVLDLSLGGLRIPAVREYRGALADAVLAVLTDGPMWIDLFGAADDVTGQYPAYVFLDDEGTTMLNLLLLARGLAEAELGVVPEEHLEAFEAVELVRRRLAVVLKDVPQCDPDELRVWNAGSVPIDVSSWSVGVRSAAFAPLPPGTILAPGEELRLYLHCSNVAWESYANDGDWQAIRLTDPEGKPYGEPTLRSGHNVIGLYDEADRLILQRAISCP
jgi:hypothetical protein